MTAALLTAVLAGCGDSEASDPPPSLPPLTASPSPSVEPATVEVPPEAREDSQVGATAFARFYFETLNEAYASRDASALRALSDPECPPCDVFIEQVEQLAADDQRLEDGDYTVMGAATAPYDGGDAIVDLVLTRPDVRIVDAQGQVVDQGGALTRTPAQLRLLRSDDAWRVRGFRFSEVG